MSKNKDYSTQNAIIFFGGLFLLVFLSYSLIFGAIKQEKTVDTPEQTESQRIYEENRSKREAENASIEKLSKGFDLWNLPSNFLNIQAFGVFEMGTNVLNPKFTKWSETIDLSWDGSGTLVVFPYFSQSTSRNSILGSKMVEKIVNPNKLETIKSDAFYYSKVPIYNTYIEEHGYLLSREGTVTIGSTVIKNLYVYEVPAKVQEKIQW